MYTLMFMFFLHFVADFLMQSREMGKKKSVQFKWLLKHLYDQFKVMSFGAATMCMIGLWHYHARNPNLYPLLGILFVSVWVGLVFAISNAIIHGIIDWNIWRLYKWSVAYRMLKDPDGVGFDSMAAHDMAHYALKNGDKKRFCELAAPAWMYWEDHWFYATIGLDQLLHGITIIGLTWWIFL